MGSRTTGSGTDTPEVEHHLGAGTLCGVALLGGMLASALGGGLVPLLAVPDNHGHGLANLLVLVPVCTVLGMVAGSAPAAAFGLLAAAVARVQPASRMLRRMTAVTLAGSVFALGVAAAALAADRAGPTAVEIGIVATAVLYPLVVRALLVRAQRRHAARGSRSAAQHGPPEA